MAIEVILQDQNSSSNFPIRLLDEKVSIKRLTNAIVNVLKLPIADAARRPITYHLSHNGRRLQDEETLVSANVQPRDAITIFPEMIRHDQDHDIYIEGYEGNVHYNSYNELTDNLPPGVRLRQTLTLNREQQASSPWWSFSKIANESLNKRVSWSSTGNWLAVQTDMPVPDNPSFKLPWINETRFDQGVLSQRGSGALPPPPEDSRGPDESYEDLLNDAITGLAWSPQKEVLFYSTKKRIRLWDVAKGEIQQATVKSAEPITNIALSSDGETLAYSTKENIWLWNMETEQQEMLSVEGTDIPTCLAWSPDGEMLISSSSNQDLHLWDVKTRTLKQTYAGHMSDITSVAWSPDGNTIASASTDRTIRIWDTRTERHYVLEGHSDQIVSLSFNSNGRLLASQSIDGTILLWRSDIWQTIAAIHEPSIRESGLAFHPTIPALATFGEDNATVHIWDIDLTALFGADLPDSSIYYRNAKVALIGDTGVGKSGLGLVLTDKPFRNTPSSHACQVLLFDSREVKLSGGHTETREIYLWDLAGQPGYRVTHQFHLHKLAVALIVFDSRNESDPFAGVDYWNRALSQASRVQGAAESLLKKFLVAARVDRNGPGVNQERIQALIKDLRCDGWFETSARDRKGIAELKEAIHEAIDWGDTFAGVSSSTLFQQIKKFLIDQKNSGDSLALRRQLYTAFCRSAHAPLDTNELHRHFDTCLSSLERMDLIRIFSRDDLVLLQPELLDIYGSALINTVKIEPHGWGTISIDKVHNAEFLIPTDKRIQDEKQEHLLLLAMVEDLLSKEIALNEYLSYENILIFPAQTTRKNPAAFTRKGKTVVFTFDGPVLNIYATLVVRLSRTNIFKNQDFWENEALYTTEEGGKYRLLLENTGEGTGRLTLFFEDSNKQRRDQFEDFSHEHLKRKAENVQRERVFRCIKCEEAGREEVVLTHDMAWLWLKNGNTSIPCPSCRYEILLIDSPDILAPSQQTIISQMNYEADKQRDREVQNYAVPISIHIHLEQNNLEGNDMSDKKGDTYRIRTGDITSTNSNVNLGAVGGDIVLNAAEQNRLAEALESLREAVASSRVLTQEDKEEHIGVVTQITEETAKKKPNRAVLQGLLASLKLIPDVTKAVTDLMPVLNELHILK